MSSSKTRRSRHRQNGVGYNRLEPRQLLAGLGNDPGVSTVSVEASTFETSTLFADTSFSFQSGGGSFEFDLPEQNVQVGDNDVNVSVIEPTVNLQLGDTTGGTVVTDSGNLSDVIDAIDVSSLPINEMGQGVPSLELSEVRGNLDQFIIETPGLDRPEIEGDIIQVLTPLDEGANQFSVSILNIDTDADGQGDRVFVDTLEGEPEDFTAAWRSEGANGVLEGVPVDQIAEIESFRFVERSAFFQFPDTGPIFWARADINGTEGSVDFDLRPELSATPDLNVEVMATFATTVNFTEAVNNTTNNQSFVAPITTVNAVQPVFAARPVMNLTEFPRLFGAINSPANQFVSSPTIHQPIEKKADCPCEGAAETVSDSVEKMQEAVEPSDLESPQTPTQTEEDSTDKAFEGWDVDNVEGFDLLPEGNEPNLAPTSSNFPVFPKSTESDSTSAAAFGTLAVLGLAATGIVTILRRD